MNTFYKIFVLVGLFSCFALIPTYAQGPITFRSAVIIAPTSITLNTPVGYGLYVSDGILTERLRISIKNGSNWADYVFEPSYKLAPLPQVKQFIEQYGHLPDVPSATEIAKSGVDVADTQRLLLQKIEELTLYVIRQDEQIRRMRQKIKRLEHSKK
jgi:hypothetical protein